MTNKQIKAVALLSGGLDSMLAAKLILEQGVHVEAINFYTGFCVEGHTKAIRKQDKAKPKRNNALWAAEQLGIKLHFVDVVEDYKDVVLNPQHGYGAHMNPCLDCKIFMVSRAKYWMEKNGFDFIITGEVIGQRPMSQRKATMPIVANKSGAEDRLLRPLCARNLPETLPEREGWVDREKLKAWSGRSRKPQIEMAKQFDFIDYAQPAGGCCFLTDKNYTKKLTDLWSNRGERNYELEDIVLLKVGRHLRPNARYKMIISREEGENNFLRGFKNRYAHLSCSSHNGPLVIIDGDFQPQDMELAARIVGRYSAGRDAEQVTIEITDKDGQQNCLQVAPMRDADIMKEWYL